MGVDFIVLTQHPMLIHGNLVRLVGRHLHVRRMGNMGLAIVYEWDSCSRTLLYKNALAKSPYRYSSEVFKLYKSAELHTKQPRKMPSLVWGILFALGAMAFFAPSVYSRIADRINPPAVDTASKPGFKVTTTTTLGGPPGQQPVIPALPVPPAPEAVQAAPAIAGCAQVRTTCRCYDPQGFVVETPQDVCTARIKPAIEARQNLAGGIFIDHETPRPYAGDTDVLRWMHRNTKQPLEVELPTPPKTKS